MEKIPQTFYNLQNGAYEIMIIKPIPAGYDLREI